MEGAREPGLEAAPAGGIRFGIARRAAIDPVQLAACESDVPGPAAAGLRLENSGELRGQRFVFDEHPLLTVEPGGTWIEVVAAHEGMAAVRGQRLGVQAGAG